MVKVLGIACSLRKGSNSGVILDRALEGARAAGAETERLNMLDAKINPCDGCRGCLKSGVCLIEDDMQDWLPKIAAADGVIFSTPVYFWTVPGQTKTLIDRLYPLYNVSGLTNKVGAAMAVCTSTGQTGVWQVFAQLFNSSHMLSADFVAAFAKDPGDVRRDRMAMTAAFEQGKQVVQLASSGFKYPADYPEALYGLMRKRHGIDSSPMGNRFEEAPVGVR